MIRLEIDDYCNNCSRFDPDVEIISYTEELVNTTIKCKNRYTCESIKNYLLNVFLKRRTYNKEG